MQQDREKESGVELAETFWKILYVAVEGLCARMRRSMDEPECVL